MDRSNIYKEDPGEEFEEAALPLGAHDQDVSGLLESVEQLEVRETPMAAGGQDADIVGCGTDLGDVRGERQEDFQDGGSESFVDPVDFPRSGYQDADQYGKSPLMRTPSSGAGPASSTHARPYYEQRPQPAPHQKHHHTSPPSSLRAQKIVAKSRNNSAPVWQPVRNRTDPANGNPGSHASSGGGTFTRGISWLGGMRSTSPSPTPMRTINLTVSPQRQSYAKVWTAGGGNRGAFGSSHGGTGGGAHGKGVPASASGGRGGLLGRRMSVGANSYRWGQAGELIKESPIWGPGGGGQWPGGVEINTPDRARSTGFAQETNGEQSRMNTPMPVGIDDQVVGGQERYQPLEGEFDFDQQDMYPPVEGDFDISAEPTGEDGYALDPETMEHLEGEGDGFIE